MSPSAVVLAGFGLNCEHETAVALDHAGANARIIHLADVDDGGSALREAQIAVIPGGFSFGDHTGAGNALGHLVADRLLGALLGVLDRGGLVAGICNGCQVLARSGLLDPPGGPRTVALRANIHGSYEDRWVHVRTVAATPWLPAGTRLELPIAHGEGAFVVTDAAQASPCLRYVTADGAPAAGRFPANPNGSQADIAALTTHAGRLLAMMPHPERAIFARQRPDWPRQLDAARRGGEPPARYADGFRLFRNAVAFFR